MLKKSTVFVLFVGAISSIAANPYKYIQEQISEECKRDREFVKRLSLKSDEFRSYKPSLDRAYNRVILSRALCFVDYCTHAASRYSAMIGLNGEHKTAVAHKIAGIKGCAENVRDKIVCTERAAMNSARLGE